MCVYACACACVCGQRLGARSLCGYMYMLTHTVSLVYLTCDYTVKCFKT